MSGMLEIKSFTFGPFATNTYVVSNEQGNALLIDPACSNQYEQQQLENYINALPSKDGSKAGLSAIVATHGHLDHLWGARWATDKWQLPVLLHPADIPMAQAMQEQYNLFGIRATTESFPIAALEANFRPFGEGVGMDFSMLETPGHTQGSVCFYWPEEQTLISGDTLFCMGYGRTDLPGGSTAQLIRSLEKLFALPTAVRVYPGHGETTTIGAERR